ncbi:hypothetical protein [Chitinasiproducens palmae]|uniref:Uncharacterized protein n=1 Tax=Chitinasiproducens palmae TaxID=1770053 RepID=A0A1H2PTC3_9BURK|nr:hypothetical protein [Chitinasiproducens palmae]SDV50340.1 hypothetical protein SAMN05216551_111110 [Chitinasiproducens palmae]
MAFKAFDNDSEVVSIHGDAFTIENDPLRIALHGELEIARDKAGLKTARALKQAIDAIVTALEADHGLPAVLPDEPAPSQGSVDNPF